MCMHDLPSLASGRASARRVANHYTTVPSCQALHAAHATARASTLRAQSFGSAREVVEEPAQQPVEALRARDAHPLSGCMRAFDLGSDGDHLDSGEPLADDGAFEPSVHHLEHGLGAEEALEGATRRGEELRL